MTLAHEAARAARGAPAAASLRALGGWLDLAVPCTILGGLAVQPWRAGSVGDVSLEALVVAWVAFLIARLALAPSTRVLTVFFAAFTAYSTAAWVAATAFEVIYPPFPSLATIEWGTLLSLASVVLAFVVLRLVPLDLATRRFQRAARALIVRAGRMTDGQVVLASVPLLLVGLRDGQRLLALGLDVVFATPRRGLQHELLAESNHNVQVVAVAASIALGLFLLTRRPDRAAARALAGLGLLAFWLPLFAIGARKNALIVVVVVGLVALLGRPSVRGRRIAVAAALLGLALFAFPAVTEGRLDQSTIEFVYPQYFLFTDIERDLELDYGYGKGALLMVPAPLRPQPVVDLGLQFTLARITNVGVGAHPVGEAYLVAPRFVVPLAAGATVALVLVTLLLARASDAFLFIGVAHALLWGRSDLWITLFFITYQGLVLWLFLGGPTRRAEPRPRLPRRHQPRTSVSAKVAQR